MAQRVFYFDMIIATEKVMPYIWMEHYNNTM